MQKEIKDLELYKLFFRYLIPYSKNIAFGLAAIPFSICSTLIIPWLIIQIVDKNIVSKDIDGIIFMVSLLGITVIIGYFSDSIYTFTIQKIGQLAIKDMRSDLYNHILLMPRSFFDKQPIGKILTRVTSDIEAINDSLAIGVISIFTDFLKTVALLIFLILISWQLTIVVFLIFPPIYLLSTFLRKKLRYYYNLTREALADSTGFLQECLNGVKTIQLYASEKKVQTRFEEKTKNFFQAQSYSNFFDATLFSFIEGITSIALALLIWYGAQQISKDLVSIGVLIAFINTLNRIFVPIREFTQQVSILQRSLSSLENIEKLFREIPNKDNKRFDNKNYFKKILYKINNFNHLSFENVFFKYNEKDPWILKDVSFFLKKGDRIAIVGSTGSGKSTILRLITKTYTNYQGSIKINGIELNNISRPHLLKILSTMQQESHFFDESINFNISLNRPNIT